MCSTCINNLVTEADSKDQIIADLKYRLERAEMLRDSAVAMSEYRIQRILKLEAKLERLEEAVEMLWLLLSFGTSRDAFKNGNTDPTGLIDEGDVRASEVLDRVYGILKAEGLLPQVSPPEPKPVKDPPGFIRCARCAPESCWCSKYGD